LKCATRIEKGSLKGPPKREGKKKISNLVTMNSPSGLRKGKCEKKKKYRTTPGKRCWNKEFLPPEDKKSPLVGERAQV